MRTLTGLFVLTFVATTVAAQGKDDPDKAVKGSAAMPAGWTLRLDSDKASRDNLKFETMGAGMHVTAGPAAIYWNPKHEAKGPFTATATFTMMKLSAHPEAYGLVWAGVKLDGADQAYLYYVVRQDGKYLVKHRLGTETHGITPWSDSPAINKPDASGKQVNKLAVAVGKDSVRLFANDKPVAAYDVKVMTPTDGIVGIRVNHNLDVHIEGPTIKK